MSTNELQHWGIKGMKWGVRKKLQNTKIVREQKKIDKKLNLRYFGPNQGKVLYDRNAFINKNKTVNNKWEAAFKAGKGTKEWDDYENARKDYIHRLNKRFKQQYVDAWIEDNNMQHLTDKGREYVENNIERIWPTR